MRADGRRAGLDGIKNAFSNMITDFALEIQNHEVTLEALVKDKACWTHHWKDSDLALEAGAQSKRARGSSESEGGFIAKPMTEEVIKMVRNNDGLLRALQSQLDRRDRPQPPAASSGGDAGKDGKKGAGKSANAKRKARQVNKWVRR